MSPHGCGSLALLLFCSWSSASSQGIHRRMSEAELLHYFDVSHPDQVDEGSYQLVSITQEDALPHMDKRNGATLLEREEVRAIVNMEAFGRQYRMTLRRNTDLLMEGADVVVSGEAGDEPVEGVDPGCHYLVDGGGGLVGGSLTACSPGEYRGLIRDRDRVIDIKPLRHSLRDPAASHHHLARLATPEELEERLGGREAGRIHAVAKDRIKQLMEEEGGELEGAAAGKYYEDKDYLEIPGRNPHTKNFLPEVGGGASSNGSDPAMRRKRGGDYGASRLEPIVLELAVFFDCNATNSYLEFFDRNSTQVVQLMLSLVNSMQSVFNLPSLGRTIKIVIVYVELQKQCSIKTSGGDREPMLMNFCSFQKELKKAKGKIWDLALLMSGLDMYYKDEYGKMHNATMGLSTVTGVCEEEYSCVVGEVGVTDRKGKPYPSCGFLTVYVFVHEIGHNFGMHHDSTGNECPSDGYIESPTRGTAGESKWSACSRRVVQALELPCLFDPPHKIAVDHNKFGEAPGMVVTAIVQCIVLMKDRTARVDVEGTSQGLAGICNSLRCRSSNRYGLQYGGPALPGTDCGGGKVCFEGECVHHAFDDVPPPRPAPAWSEWSGAGDCRHNCLEGSVGVARQRRTCPEFGRCAGEDTKVEVCAADPADDCPPGALRSTRDFATLMCLKFKRTSPLLDSRLEGEGKMVSFNRRFPKRVCAIHCLATDGGRSGYFAPVTEMNPAELDGYSPYFPDGTLCHTEGSKKFYCIGNSCVLPGGRGGRSGAPRDGDEDYSKVQRADPGGKKSGLDPYFFTKDDGSPAGSPAGDDGDGGGGEISIDGGGGEIKKWKV